jgi:hypothetical protein
MRRTSVVIDIVNLLDVVVNAGIGGNRLLASAPVAGSSALSRLDRDVVPGVIKRSRELAVEFGVAVAGV